MASGGGQTVVVLGGGIGGVAAANRLRRRLDRDQRVVLVNRDPDFTSAASYLWVMTGSRRPEQTTRPLKRLERRGIRVVIGEVTDIDPGTRTLTVGERTLTADHLVVSLGADWATDKVPGLGDNTHIVLGIGKPLPRAGVLAHAQAQVVADTITATITAKPAPAGFDGHGGCFIETGAGRAAYGSGNFYADPAPKVALHPPARRWHWGKVTFEQRVMRRWL